MTFYGAVNSQACSAACHQLLHMGSALIASMTLSGWLITPGTLDSPSELSF